MVLHYHLATPHGPTAFWHHLVRKRFLPGNTFSADDLLHHLSGVDREEIKHELRDLATQRVIEFDRQQTSRWPVSTRPQEVEEVIQKAVDCTVVDSDLMEMITKRLSSLGISSLNFGHEYPTRSPDRSRGSWNVHSSRAEKAAPAIPKWSQWD